MAGKIYDIQPGESSKAYEAFALYRDMGVNRSHAAVAEKLSKSTTIISRWASQNDWAERIEAYDQYIEAKARAKLEQEAVQRKVDMLKRHGMAGRLMQRKAAEYLDQHGMEKSADAINAMQKGIAIERAAEGLPEYLLEIMNADDNDLLRQYHELLTMLGNSQIEEENIPKEDNSAV